MLRASRETQYELLKKVEEAESQGRRGDAYLLRRRLRHQMIESGAAICEGALDCAAIPTMSCADGTHSTCPNHAASCAACEQAEQAKESHAATRRSPCPAVEQSQKTDQDEDRLVGLRASVRAGRRRSDRISMSLPIEIAGTDLSGRDFLCKTVTKQICRHGGSMLVNLDLGPEQIVILRRRGRREKTQVRIVGQVGLQAEGHVYGFAFVGNADKVFWGIHFPGMGDDDFMTKVLLECARCSRRELVPLSDVEFEVFEANDRITRQCGHCHQSTAWKQAAFQKVEPAAAVTVLVGDSNSPPPLAPPVPSSQDQRRTRRVKVTMKGCIMVGSEQEIVAVLNMARGGMRFHSQRRFGLHQWVQVAVPFTVGGANIFRAARIVWRVERGATDFDYGLKYVSN